jgi:hypothetical protein
VLVAAQVMRRVLVDYARQHNAQIRGGGLKRVELEEWLAISPERIDEVVSLDEALSRLAEENPRQARVVELRYFGGLSVEQIAALLGIAERSVKRDWHWQESGSFESSGRTPPVCRKPMALKNSCRLSVACVVVTQNHTHDRWTFRGFLMTYGAIRAI